MTLPAFVPPKFGAVFISYARADAEDFAKWLHDHLMSEDIETWLDKRNIAAGVRFDASIEDAIKACGLFVLIVSPGSAASDYCKLEFECATQYNKPLAPIMFITASPAYLDDKINYIAHDAAKEHVTLAQLRIKIRETRATTATLTKPAAAPISGRTRKPNTYPPKSIGDFRDREKPRADIQNYLRSGALLISIYGQGGVGKTALAVEVLTELEAADPPPDLIVALRETRADSLTLADRGISVEKIFLDSGRALGGEDRAQIEAIWTSRAELAQKCAAFAQVLGGRRCIVLIDNLETLQDPATGKLIDAELVAFLEAMLPLGANFQVLLTSRERVALPRTVTLYEKPVPLTEGLPADDAITVLIALDNDGHERVKKAARATLETLVTRTKGFPRARISGEYAQGRPAIDARQAAEQSSADGGRSDGRVGGRGVPTAADGASAGVGGAGSLWTRRDFACAAISARAIPGCRANRHEPGQAARLVCGGL